MNDMTTLFDISKPGAFLALYRTLIGLRKPGQKEPLIRFTGRLISSYLKIEKALTKAREVATKGIINWLTKRSAISKLEKQMEQKKSVLMTWVKKSVSFFCIPA